jgi:2-polyprenyl-3-methyl-5-hydroxy-6-metoxy-1,4-benzoquinol methylase
VSEALSACPLCTDDRSKFFEEIKFRGQNVTYRLCEHCGLVYQSPRMTQAETSAFYAQEYRLLNEGSALPTRRNLANQRGRAASLQAFSKPSISAIRQHLDIGCSTGSLLQVFQQAYQCQSIGIEPGEAHRDYARKAGLTVYASVDELELAEISRFDLISMAHVLEHLADPVRYLAHLRDKLLEPTGWLLIEVPNLYVHDSFEPAHLVAYSAHTLRQTMEMAGFEILRLEEHGRPRSAWLPLYITLLAQPRSAPKGTFRLRPEGGVKFKRQVGIFSRHVLERIFYRWIWNANEG